MSTILSKTVLLEFPQETSARKGHS